MSEREQLLRAVQRLAGRPVTPGQSGDFLRRLAQPGRELTDQERAAIVRWLAAGAVGLEGLRRPRSSMPALVAAARPGAKPQPSREPGPGAIRAEIEGLVARPSKAQRERETRAGALAAMAAAATAAAETARDRANEATPPEPRLGMSEDEADWWARSALRREYHR